MSWEEDMGIKQNRKKIDLREEYYVSCGSFKWNGENDVVAPDAAAVCSFYPPPRRSIDAVADVCRE